MHKCIVYNTFSVHSITLFIYLRAFICSKTILLIEHHTCSISQEKSNTSLYSIRKTVRQNSSMSEYKKQLVMFRCWWSLRMTYYLNGHEVNSYSSTYWLVRDSVFGFQRDLWLPHNIWIWSLSSWKGIWSHIHCYESSLRSEWLTDLKSLIILSMFSC